MNIHNQPIEERIDWLFDLANRHGTDFRSPEAWIARKRYLAEHPTGIGILKCMDGRVNIAFATKTPVGIMMPFRNLGGIFDLGWPHLGEVLSHYVNGIVSTGRRVILLITYHFSKGAHHRGCAGFGYDTAAAIAHTYRIQQQAEYIFGTGHGTVYPLVCGFETDEDALIIHGVNGEKLDLSEFGARDRASLEPRIASLLPDLSVGMRADLLPLLYGNLDHIDEMRAQMRRGERSLDIDHGEWTICLGRGFDFLHTPNTALIIGPYSPNLAEPVRRAAGIIQSNMAAGRIPDDGFLLFTSVPYDEIGVDRARARLKSRFLSKFASEVIRAEFPDLATKMAIRTAILDWPSRRLERFDPESRSAPLPASAYP